MDDTGNKDQKADKEIQEIIKKKPNTSTTYSVALILGIVLIGIFVLRYLDPEHTDATFMMASVGAAIGIIKFIWDRSDQDRTQNMLASAVTTTAAKIDKAEAKIDNNTNITSEAASAAGVAASKASVAATAAGVAATAAGVAAIKTNDLTETIENINQAVNGASDKRADDAYTKGKIESHVELEEWLKATERRIKATDDQMLLLHKVLSDWIVQNGGVPPSFPVFKLDDTKPKP